MNPLPTNIQQDILTQYEPLVHHVLKRLFIQPRSNDYDDLAQIARIALLHAAHHTKVNPLSKIEKDRYQFVSFARSRMQWAVTDELRKLGNYQDKETAVETFPIEESPQLALEETLDWNQKWRNILPQLNKDQLTLLYLLLDDSLTHTDRAKALKLSRKTYYKRKSQLAEKLVSLKDFSNKG